MNDTAGPQPWPSALFPAPTSASPRAMGTASLRGLFSVVREQDWCHMHCLSRVTHVRLVGCTKKEKQQLDMNVCVQTNESKACCVCRENAGGGHVLPPLVFLQPDPAFWVLRCEAETHRWAAVCLFLPSPSFRASIHFNSSIQLFCVYLQHRRELSSLFNKTEQDILQISLFLWVSLGQQTNSSVPL